MPIRDSQFVCSGDGPLTRIHVACEDSQIVLTVSPKGKGISGDRLESANPGVKRLGVGVARMRERVRQLGRDLQIQAGDPGTAFKVKLPTGVEYVCA